MKLNLLSIAAGAPASKLEISDDLEANRNLPMVLVGYSLAYLDFNPLQYMTYLALCGWFVNRPARDRTEFLSQQYWGRGGAG